MPESPLELLRNGQVANLPWMTGLTSEEGPFFNHYIIQIIWFLFFYLYLGAWYISSLYGQDSMEFLKEYDQNPIEATKALGGEFLTGIIFLRNH